MEVDPTALDAAKQFLFGDTEEFPEDAEEQISELLAAQQARLKELSEMPARTPARGQRPSSQPPTGVELKATGIQRVGRGWQARCRLNGDLASRFFADSKHGGYIPAFLEALDYRDELYRESGRRLPPRIAAVVDGELLAPRIERTGDTRVVRWRGKKHRVTGEDADEIATEVALNLFVEFLEAKLEEERAA